MNAMDTERIEELVSAALDGEPVDVDALRQALATLEGRDALAAFVVLRAATASDAVESLAQASAHAMAAISRSQPGPRRLPSSRVRLAVAASLAVLAIPGAFWFGSTWQAQQVVVHLTPPQAPVVRTDVAPVVAPAVTVLSPSAGPCPQPAQPQPPTPTRVVRYVRGVDWRDGT